MDQVLVRIIILGYKKVENNLLLRKKSIKLGTLNIEKIKLIFRYLILLILTKFYYRLLIWT